jgi:hypothetical protein
MAFQLSPGVVVTEQDRTTLVPSVATTAGAFAGAFQWGPVEEVTTVDSEKNLVTNFGQPNDATAGYFFTAANFLSYGNNLKLVRVVDKSVARNATSTPSGTIASITVDSSSNTYTSLTGISVAIAAPGVEGGIQATANAVLANTGAINTITMSVLGRGYSVAPVVNTSANLSATGTAATAFAILGSGNVVSLTVLSGGNNYNSNSNIVISGGGGAGATGNLQISYSVANATIISGGNGYSNSSLLVISGGGGSGANIQLVATGTDGIITSFNVINVGSGYTSMPNVSILRNGPQGSNANANISVTLGHGTITGANIVNAGTGYSSGITVNVNKNNTDNFNETNASIIGRMEASVVGVSLSTGGSGYTAAPIITFVPDPVDSPAVTAIATSDIRYAVDRITLTNAGTGYSSAPVITVTVPNGAVSANAVLYQGSILIENSDDYDANYSNGGLLYGQWAAKYPGILGNSIKVSLADSGGFTGWQYASQFDAAPATSAYVTEKGGSGDELHIIVIDAKGSISGTAGSVLEKFSFVSKASDAKNSDGSTNYYKNVINNQSKYIWWLNHHESGNDWGTASTTAFDVLGANLTQTLSAGVAGDSVTAGNLTAGYALFSNDELYDVSLIPMGPTTTASVVNSVIAIADSRRDCVVFASPQYADVVNTTGQADKIVTYRNTLTDSSFAVLDSGWKYQYDRYNDKYRYVPLNGDIAGLAARTDYIADPWFSPAGYNRGVIKNVVKLAYSPSKTDRDTLYKKGINPVVTFPGQGTLLFGDKTLQSRPSAFDRINVRRLFIVLEKAIATASKFQLFEFNDPFTRGQFRNLVEPFLRDVQGRRGISDFRVVCDETNNTAEVIDRNEFVADIFIKPARAINFIQLNFVATRTGVSFEEVGA